MVSSISEKISLIPEDARENLFCTLHNQPMDPEARKKKVWGTQKHLLFDIDGIPKHRTPEIDVVYREVLSDVLKITPGSILQVFSGHGYHFIVELATPIEDRKFFSNNKIYYQILCARINERIKEQGLSGEADGEVFAPNRLLRLPLSFNKKKGMDAVPVELIHGEIIPVEINLQELSGLPLVDKKEQLSDKELSYIKTDTDTVLSGCEFLKWAKDYQADVNESQWYAVLSIVGRVAGAEKLIHTYSKNHPTYHKESTTRKAAQAIKASGPRTCDNISTLWGGCKKCPHYKKVRSPIALKGKDFIATAHSGFHAMAGNGRLVPQYGDLQKYYDKQQPYKNVGRVHHRYVGTHWEEFDDIHIDNYAQDHFVPQAKNTMRAEFKGLIKCTNLETPKWFSKSTDRKLNLMNGVLNIDTLKLEPHSERLGFKHVLPFEFDAGAECPTFLKMLHGVTKGRQELKTVLLQYMGYCLSNDRPKADKILVLTGEGQNGKSRFLSILRAMGGPGVTALGVRDLTNAFHMQQLDGALFNIIEEVPSFTRKDTWEIIKDLVTGGLVTAARKFKDPYTFQNKAKFIMTCNELPRGANPNHGFFRRMTIVPFDEVFSHEKGNIDVGIHDRIIENELPGVLNLVLKAYADLKANNYQFQESKVIKEALLDYQRDLDSVARFVEDTIIKGDPPLDTGSAPDFFIMHEGKPALNMEDYYAEYAERCQKLGEKSFSFREFSKRVYRSVAAESGVYLDMKRAKGVLYFRARVQGVRKRLLVGVKWC